MSKSAELLDLQERFRQQVEQDKTVSSILRKLEGKTADYADAHALAVRYGEILADSFGAELGGFTGVMPKELAEMLIRPMLGQNYELVSEAAQQVQQMLNERAGIGLKAIKAPLNVDRVDGIIGRVCEEPFEDVHWILGDPVINLTQSVVDDTLKVNADAQYRAGLTPKIVRTMTGKGCDWCRRLAGSYRYPDVPEDVYRRHENCRCTTAYDPRTGRVRDVWSKRWTDKKR